MYSIENGGTSRAEAHACFLAALSNPARLQIVAAVRLREVNVCELSEICGLSQSAVSQHLAKLRRRQIVKTRRDGQTVYYSLASPEAESLLSLLADMHRVAA
ncbi:ArsR/SmtB family transcription factor [Agrobacterium tumefaciens]|uniref:ArsR/SmtB family transcription factor n=1 Tax=Agrobacterium tumefaciens TaxID=358 RepID=UPI0009822AE8|nr:metalloregulator ArsR/SmtB family transcription factor [Agrobacterium tumefaciens]